MIFVIWQIVWCVFTRARRIELQLRELLQEYVFIFKCWSDFVFFSPEWKGGHVQSHFQVFSIWNYWRSSEVKRNDGRCNANYSSSRACRCNTSYNDNARWRTYHLEELFSSWFLFPVKPLVVAIHQTYNFSATQIIWWSAARPKFVLFWSHVRLMLCLVNSI